MSRIQLAPLAVLQLVLLAATVGTQAGEPPFGEAVAEQRTAELAAGSNAAAINDAGVGLDLDAIVARANEAAYYKGNDGRAEVRLTIEDSQGREQRRQFTVLRRDIEDGGDQDFLVVFSQPADVRNTVFLVKKHVGTDDDRWIYLPGLDLVKRISAGDKRTSFVGSNVFYEDISGRGTEEDIHELVEDTADAFVLRHTPKDPSTVEFHSYTTWIDKQTFLPIKIEYANNAGKVTRRIEALKVEEIGGHPTVTESRVTDLESGGATRMQFRFVNYDVGLPDNVFTERSLRRPPAEWLQRPEKS